MDYGFGDVGVMGDSIEIAWLFDPFVLCWIAFIIGVGVFAWVISKPRKKDNDEKNDK